VQTLAVTLAATVLLALGFAARYLARDLVSRRRRARLAEMEMMWGLPPDVSKTAPRS
jgi:hypothetical protein